MSSLLRREVLGAIYIQLFSVFALGIFGAYYVIVLDDLRASAIIIGIVLTMRNFVQIFLRIPFSELSQIVGRKPLIITGNLCYSGGLGLVYLADHWSLVLIASLLVGIGMSMHWPAFFSYVGDISDGDYGRTQGFIFMGQDIGTLSAAFMAAYLLDNDLISVTGLFGISFLISFFATITSTSILSEVLEDEHRKAVNSIPEALFVSFTNMVHSVIYLTKQYALRIIFFFELLFTFVEFFVTSFTPLLIVTTLGYEDSVVTSIIFFTTLILIIFKPVIGNLFDKYGFRTPVILSMVLTSCMIALLPITRSYTELLVVYTILTASIMVGYISATGGTSNSASVSERGLAMGVLGVYISMGRTSSSFILSPILELFEYLTGSREEGLKFIFWFTAAIALLCTSLMALYSRDFDNRVKVATIELDRG